MSELTMGSLFDGIGGFPLAAVRNGITPVWASEIEPFPIEVTKTHFPDMMHVGDITKLKGAELPPVDIICGGSPCQDCSVASGTRAGLQGARSGLFFEQIRITKELRDADILRGRSGQSVRPRYFCWENVPYFTYDEFSAWIENETETIQKLVDAGEWTEAEATEALEYYDEILKSILEGKMVGKRASSSDDQLFFSMPDNAQPEQYQTFVFDGNTYKSIGPFDTEEELFNALKEYTDTEVEAGTMSQAEATALLEKYQ